MKNAMAKKSFIIAGPTASGKSDFAEKLARKIGGSVINADSVQIYRGIENISASPLADGDKGVPHALYSIRDLGERLNVSEYLDLARAEYEAAAAPIFVGGTGYYIDAIINGISPIPDVSAENRARARQMIAADPDAARRMTDFQFGDPQRMARALEVFLETGRPLAEWQRLPRAGGVSPAPVRVLISPPKEILAERIRRRLPEMLAMGGMDEVAGHIDYGDRAIGIFEIGKYLRGEASLDEAVESWAVRTIQYAKRQRTWFNNRYAADIVIARIPTDEDAELVTSYESDRDD
jgi:tRNA dimethylallyltransferase